MLQCGQENSLDRIGSMDTRWAKPVCGGLGIYSVSSKDQGKEPVGESWRAEERRGVCSGYVVMFYPHPPPSLSVSLTSTSTYIFRSPLTYVLLHAWVWISKESRQSLVLKELASLSFSSPTKLEEESGCSSSLPFPESLQHAWLRGHPQYIFVRE